MSRGLSMRLSGIAIAGLVGLFPALSHAATATYTSTDRVNFPSNRDQPVEVTMTLDVVDDFSIADLNISWHISGANLASLTATLTSPAGTNVVVYSRRVSDRNMDGTTFDDEASKLINQDTQAWRGVYLPEEPLSAFDGQSAAGTWTLSLAFVANPDGTGRHQPNTSSAHLADWTLAFEGADPASITGTKFQDSNSNGQQDAGEPGLPGWEIQLSNGDTTMTAADGSYEFTDLDIDDYVVREVEQAGWLQVTPATKQYEVRTHHGQTTGGLNFANIPLAETEESIYRNDTLTFIPQNESQTVTSTIQIDDPRIVADVNVTLRLLNGRNLGDLDIGLTGPNGQRVELTRHAVNGRNFGNTTFDDESSKDLGDDVQAWTGSYKPNQPLGVFNTHSAQGTWTLDVTDTRPGSDPPARLEYWILTVRTPLVQEPDPVVIVPGMLASLSPLTTFLDVPSDFWVFNLVARGVYNSLLQQFESAGMFENQDVFVAHYDWKQPVADNAGDYLKPVIDSVKQQTGKSKVDIVAHSMGGLVARSYIQSNDYEGDVDQLVTLGTPHLGAADAYVAWEGGFFPETWSAGIRLFVRNVVRSLNFAKDLDLEQPVAFRVFFPALRDLLPIVPTITRDGSDVPPSALFEQNTTLEQLRSSIGQIEANDVDVAAIVGTNVATLAVIDLANSRTNEDGGLDRWRDGHPIIEPILPDSNAGDERVLVSSAEFGNNIIQIPGAQHEDLPEEAQEEILAVLGIEPPEPFHYEAPNIDRLLGLVVLSPVDPSIICGDQVISKNENTFDHAQYIVDPSHPDGPKVLTVGNPPDGECTVELLGTGSGEYTAITTYADEGDTVTTQRTSTTSPEQVDSFSLAISEGSLLVPPEDIVALVSELKDLLKGLKREGHIESKHFGKLNGKVGHLQGKAKSYQHQVEKHGATSEKARKKFTELQEAFAEFRQVLQEHTNEGLLDDEAIRASSGLVERLRNFGL